MYGYITHIHMHTHTHSLIERTGKREMDVHVGCP